MGGAASNPIDEQRTERIKEITQRIVGYYSKNYVLALKDVLLEDIKRKRRQAALTKIRKDKKSKATVARRNRSKKRYPAELSSKVTWYYRMDSHIDEYIVSFIIGSTGHL